MSDLTDDQTPDPAPRWELDTPDVVPPLGPVAYGLFVLNEPGPLAQVSSLAASQAAWVPSQDGRSPERDLFQAHLLDELGALDL